jgi:hypothetical protein
VADIVHEAQAEKSLVPFPKKADFPAGRDSQFTHQFRGHGAWRHGNIALEQFRDQLAMLDVELKPLRESVVRNTLGIAKGPADL